MSEIGGQPKIFVHLHVLVCWLSISEIEGQPQRQGFKAVGAVRLSISEIEGQPQRRAVDPAFADWLSISEIEGQPQRGRTTRFCDHGAKHFVVSGPTATASGSPVMWRRG